MPSRDALMLPDVLTEGDNLEMPPLPDASFLLSQLDDDANMGRKRRAGSRDINLLEDLQGSQFLQSSIENHGYDDEALVMDAVDDLGLDFGEMDDMDIFSKNDETGEIGRDAPEARPAADDLFSELDVQIPAKDNFPEDRDQSLNLDFGGGEDGIRMIDDDGDMDMLNIGDGPDVSALPNAPVIDRARISESPLSDIDENLALEGQNEFDRTNNTALYEPEEETEQSIFRNPAQRARRQKLLQPDSQTTITTSQVKEQQANRSKILQAPSFLPRDPELLALIEMQQNGGFVSNIMGDGRSSGWAPELRGMLSLDAIRKTGERKRKRDSGIADMESEGEGPSKAPRLELGEDEDNVGAGLRDGVSGHDETIVAADGTILEMVGDDELVPNIDDEDHNASAGLVESPQPDFDETRAPLIHPADNGPVSLGTTHAVHLLRERFGPEAANSPDKRKKSSVMFQDLLPEATTSKADATKMFFEMLVLATKDAVKVEQQDGSLGGPIRVRAKRGLWGHWAEREAGGEIEENVEAEADPAPNAGLEASRALSVTA
jgi:cohesin complex subunit SCC1